MNEALDQLSASGLVFRRGTPPEVSFLFKHALIQDAAYNTLLRAQRQESHTRIAAALEKRLADGEAVRPELLAHHLTEAGRPDKAVSFWTAAGDRALGRAAHREASVFFGRALAGLGPQEETPETLAATTLGAKGAGDSVNLETDILARHVERLLAVERAVEHTAARSTEGAHA